MHGKNFHALHNVIRLRYHSINKMIWLFWGQRLNECERVQNMFNYLHARNAYMWLVNLLFPITRYQFTTANAIH